MFKNRCVLLMCRLFILKHLHASSFTMLWKFLAYGYFEGLLASKLLMSHSNEQGNFFLHNWKGGLRFLCKIGVTNSTLLLYFKNGLILPAVYV